ncbi:MAG: hypothetical protein NVSMB64_23380 [Candidatus Velthaea sp.]
MVRFIAPLVCALLFSSLAPALADATGTVRGDVVRDGRPAAGIVVHLAGERFAETATSDAAGHFTFARVPFGHYTLHAAIGAAQVLREVDVATDSVADVILTPVMTIGRTNSTTRTVRGTPVSENALSARTIATLPRNDSLNALVQTVPGVVRFSYNEPVAHGFHGLTYELDGAPLPQTTSSNFSELIDPRSVDAVEVFTGAFPAEFGGSRQGAVVNLVSHRTVAGAPPEGMLTFGAGGYGTADVRFNERFSLGRAAIAFSANSSRTNRGIDTPTSDAGLSHAHSNLSDQFLRIAMPAGRGNQLAFDLSNQFAAFQIPIDTRASDPNDSYVSVPGTDDVQREYDRFASISLTHTTPDGIGFVQAVPWIRSSRVAYDGDLGRDVLATLPDPITGKPALQNGLRQDRRAGYLGLRLAAARSGNVHALKAGVEIARETLSDNGFYRFGNGTADRSNAVNAAGTTFGAYVQDRYALGQRFAVNAGVRYDRSTGFTTGAQLSPRFEINYAPERSTIFHAYAGRMYAAPALEDTRRDAILTQTTGWATPVYDLKPERDSYVEFGVEHTFRPGLSMYANAWQRNAIDVLDTTQLLNTPLFAVFNNAAGHAHGLELRVQGDGPRDTFFLSASLSEALAGGISGSTFLFDPGTVANTTLNPEDHDQSVAVNSAFTHRFGSERSLYATLQPVYGTGYPVNFQNGSGRLPAHLTLDASVGREPDRAARRMGFQLAGENLFDRQYLIKINNGFNTTQWAPGRRVVVRLSMAF